MNSAQFQSSAKSTPFSPLQAPDQTGALRQQLNDQLRWMREDQSMVINDRQQVAAAMDRKMRENQAFRAKDMEALAGMSKTLTDTLLQIKKDKDQNDQEEGLALYYQNGLPPDQVEAFEKDEKQLIEARDQTNAYADRLARSGAPPDAVEQVRGLSGWKRYGFMIGLAQDAGRKWPEFLDNALATDDQTQVDLGNGRVITPSQAQDKAELAAVAAVMRKRYLRVNGLTGANPALLNKYLFPNMREGEDPVISRRYRGILTAKAQETIAENEGLLVTGLKSVGTAAESWNSFMSNLRAVIDPKTGQPLGPGGARDRARDIVFAMGRSGDLPQEAMASIMAANIPGSTTETWGGKFPQLFQGLDDAIREGQEADLAAQDRAEARADKEREEELLALYAQTGGFTEEQKEQIRNAYLAAGKVVPSSIEGLLTVEQKSDQQAIEYLDDQIASGRYFTEYELRNSGYSTAVINRYLDKAKTYENGIVNNPEFKGRLQGIKDQLKNNLLGTLPPGTRPHWTLAPTLAEAENIFKSKVLELTTSGATPTQATAEALKFVQTLIADGKPSAKGPGTGIFAVASDPANPKVALADPNKGGYVGILNRLSQERAGVQNAQQDFRRLTTEYIRRGRGNAALDSAGLVSPQDLKRLDRLRTDPSGQFPSSILWLSSETKLSPWDIADRQLRAAGMEPLTKPPEIEWSSQQDPRLQRILNFSPTANRTQRAFSGSPWNVNKVPNGWGKWVDQAAKQYGIDPALLAGLLAHESAGWNPNAKSRAGALGLAQIMDNTLADGGISSQDRLDPRKSIFAAARIFSTRLNAVNGDTTLALRSYNMGLGGARRFPGGYPGDDESINYPARVLKAAATYGYGFGAGSPFRRPDLMNPRLAYRIGSLGYGSTGPHLDVKPVQPGTIDGQSGRNLPPYRQGMLDQFVLVKVNGKLVPLSKGAPTSRTRSGGKSDDAAHRARGSYGHDYAAPDGTEVYLRNGARVVGTYKGDQGTDHTIIELPDGRRFQFLHGRNAK